MSLTYAGELLLLHSRDELDKWAQAEHGRRLILGSEQQHLMLQDGAHPGPPSRNLTLGYNEQNLHTTGPLVSIPTDGNPSYIFSTWADDSGNDTLASWLFMLYPYLRLAPGEDEELNLMTVIFVPEPRDADQQQAFIYFMRLTGVDAYVNWLGRPAAGEEILALIRSVASQN